MDGCPRVEHRDGSSSLLIWPYNYSIDRNTTPEKIYNERAEFVAQIGDYIQAGGGSAPDAMNTDKLPKECSGPYWILGGEMRALDPFFPQTLGTWMVSGTDSLEGQLLLVNGCLRLRVNEKDFLLIWPVASIVKDKNSFDVYDAQGRIQARVGQKIKVWGEEFSSIKPPSSDFNELSVVQPLPKACFVAPYWVVDHIGK